MGSVFGGDGGIAQACTKAFKDNLLIISDYTIQMVDKIVETLISKGYNVKGRACDITDPTDIVHLRDFVAGNCELKAFIHTAGVSGTVKDARKVLPH